MNESSKINIVIDDVGVSVTTYSNYVIVRSLHILSSEYNWKYISAEIEQAVHYLEKQDADKIGGSITVLNDDNNVEHMVKYYELVYGIKFTVI